MTTCGPGLDTPPCTYALNCSTDETMYCIHLNIEIDAPIERVWRALCDPAEVVQWDATVIEALDAPPDYPRPGQHVQWRVRGSNSILHDQPREVEPPHRLRSFLTLGRDHMDETYTLVAHADRTSLTCYVELSTDIPLLAPLIERLRTGPATRRAFQASLAALKHHCETHP